MEEIRYWDENFDFIVAGTPGIFIRVQNTQTYETRSHDYQGNITEGAVCAIEVSSIDISLEEAKKRFVDIGLECYLDRKYLVLFEGQKFREMEDGVIASMDEIKHVWKLEE